MDRMIKTKKEVEIAGRKMVMETSVPHPDWKCECGNTHAQSEFLYHAANFQAYLEKIIEQTTGEERESALVKAWADFKTARDKAFPAPDYSKISGVNINGVEFGPDTETFKAFCRLRNNGNEPNAI